MKRVLALMLLLGTSVAADVVILNDGTRLEGKLTPTASGLSITTADGSTRQLDAADIRTIQPTSAPVPAATELASVRRQIASSAQPGLAAGRLRDFIARHPGTPAAADAQKDLETWQRRADSGLVRLGDDWVTPDQFAKLKSQSGPAADNIRLLLADAKPVEAQKALAAALKTWPSDSTLLFLNGVVLYHGKRLVPSRQAFDAAAVGDPSNPAIHNNLAVIFWQTHQQAGALLEYERAMISDVVNQTIIDNVHEALHELPPAVASTEIGRRVASRFEVLDTRLRAAMLQQHLHRYGSEWIDEAEYTARTSHDLSSNDLVSSYGQRAHRIQNRLADIDRTLTDEMRALRTIDQESNQIMPDGSVVHFERPPLYEQIVKDVADLKLEKIMKTKELQSLPKQLAEARANPGPRWTGAQVLIEDNTGAGPTTQPATTSPAETIKPTSQP